MPAIVVDTAQWTAASAIFGAEIASGILAASEGLVKALSRTGAMAGHDSAGRNWGEKYDATAKHVIRTMSDLQAGSVKLAMMLERTGFNHSMAESMSDAEHRMSVPDTADYTSLPRVLCPLLPDSAGGSGDYPTAWGLIRGAVGFEWPDGRPGRLRAAADAWSSAASQLSAMGRRVADAVSSIAQQQSPEVSDASTVCTAMGTHLTDAASGCEQLASACTAFAGSIDSTHHKVITAMKHLVELSVLIQTVGGFFAIFSFGASEIAAQTAETAEVATVAPEISAFLATFVSEAAEVTLVISRVDSEVLAIADRLTPVLAADLTTADTTMVQYLGPVGVPPPEVSAELRLDAAAQISDESEVAATRWASAKSLRAHFEKHHADFAATSPAGYSQKASEFLRRSLIEGYPQKVSADGTVRVYDPFSNTFCSYSRNGVIKTFFKPTSPTYWERQPGVIR